MIPVHSAWQSCLIAPISSNRYLHPQKNSGNALKTSHII